MKFTDIQQGFMDYIRDPSQPLPNGIEPRRMVIYRELFFNNVNGFVSSAFPVLKSLYEEQDWLTLVQQFFAEHNCHTPIFVEIAGEFLAFLQQYEMKDSDPNFLLELAHYEWLELVVATKQSSEQQQKLEAELLLSRPLQLSVCAKVAQYQYDVQHISVDYQPIEPPSQPQYFCVYRDVEEEVSFLQLNPLTAQVLALIEQRTQQQTSIGFDEIIHELMGYYPNMQAETMKSGCVNMLTQMAEKGVVVTTS
jgi:hypothetical protein